MTREPDQGDLANRPSELLMLFPDAMMPPNDQDQLPGPRECGDEFKESQHAAPVCCSALILFHGLPVGWAEPVPRVNELRGTPVLSVELPE